MKKYTLILLFSLLFFGCKKDNNTEATQTTQLTGKKWKLETYQIYDKQINEFQPIEKYEESLIIEFQGDGKIVMDGNIDPAMSYKNMQGVIVTTYIDKDNQSQEYNAAIEVLNANELQIMGDFLPFMFLGKAKYYYKAI